MLAALPRRPTPEWLLQLDAKTEPLPLRDILQGSAFYPSGGTDGCPIRYLSGYCHSFVYADYGIPQDYVEARLDTFRGYSRAFTRALPQQALHLPEIVWCGDEGIVWNRRSHLALRDIDPYAILSVYNRRDGYDASHGPERFCLLYVGTEGVAAYHALYLRHQCSPSVITLICCDGFAGNWTSFMNPRRALARSVMTNPHGLPEFLLTDRDPPPPWPWFPHLWQKASGWDAASAGQSPRYLWGRWQCGL